MCNHCRSRIDPRQMFLWGLDRERFLRWFAEKLHLRGDVRRLDENLWQLGAWSQKDGPLECFFQRGVFLSPQGRMRITAYCNALVLYGLTVPSEADCPGRRLSLLEVLRWDGSFTVTGLASLPPARGIVRFDTQSGALWAGDTCLGEVRVGSKEFFFLDCLAKSLDRFVPYADIKQFVLSRSGSRDATEEATFCQGLKSRIKKKWIARIDELIVTTNKGDGYRLRGYTGP